MMLWHHRLGHPSFQYLKQLFLSLFKKKNPSFSQCESCQLSKHHRSSFQLQPYKESKCSTLVHIDIWGPSRVTNLTNTRWFITFIDDHTRIY